MTLKSRLAELEKDNKRLRRALRPFAKAAEDLEHDDRHGHIPNSWFFDDKWIVAAARAMAMSNKSK